MRISEEQYEEWSEFAKQKKFGSISQLVRFAVDFQINQDLKENLEKLKNEQMNLISTILRTDVKILIEKQAKIIFELIEELKKIVRGS